MDYKKQETEKLQWHPALYAGLQIELREDSDNLIFENEHQLGTKPKQIDALIIKKQRDIPVKKNIGRIFRKYNVVEYKSPTDYLSIDDFYKGCAYAMFYKSDTQKVDEIPIQDITLTFISVEYPQKLVKHLKEVLEYNISEKCKGIYHIIKEKDILPVQLIVTSRLNWEDNLWLRSLTNKLEDKNQIKKIVNEYHENKRNNLYESVMDIIVKANHKEFEEAKGDMCKALEELMADVIEERVAEKVAEKVAEATKEAGERAMAQGEKNKAIKIFKKCLERGDNKQEAMDFAEIDQALADELYEKFLKEK